MSQCPSKRCVFKSCLKRSASTTGSRNESDSEFQTVWPVRKPECQKYCDETVEYSVCDGWSNRDVGSWKLGNFGDWHASVGNVPWSSVLKTPMNRHGKLVLHPLWNRHRVQIITQQPRKTKLVFLGSWIRCTAAFRTHCNLSVPFLAQTPGRVAIIDSWCDKRMNY